MKPYKKKFHSEKFGKEIEYFYTFKKGGQSRAVPTFGREDGDKFVIIQILPFLILVPAVFIIFMVIGSLGYLSVQLGLPDEIAKQLFFQDSSI